MSDDIRLFLVRHGHTTWNQGGTYLGRTDIPLDAEGETQATRLGTWAATADLDLLVSSPAQRALRTAQLAGAACGRAPRTDERLLELDFGRAEGRTLEDLRQEDPAAVEAFLHDPVEHHLPGGEHPRAAVARVRAALDAVLADGARRVLVVTHNTVLRLFLCDVLRMPLADYRRLLPLVEHCALTELSVHGGVLALRRFNAPPVAPDGGASHTRRADAGSEASGATREIR